MSSWKSRVNLRRLERISASLKDDDCNAGSRQLLFPTPHRVSIHDRLKAANFPGNIGNTAGSSPTQRLKKAGLSDVQGHAVKSKIPHQDAASDFNHVCDWMEGKVKGNGSKEQSSPMDHGQDEGENPRALPRVSISNPYTSRYRRQFRAYDSMMGFKGAPTILDQVQKQVDDPCQCSCKPGRSVKASFPSMGVDNMDADDLFDWNGTEERKVASPCGSARPSEDRGIPFGSCKAEAANEMAQQSGRKRKCLASRDASCLVTSGSNLGAVTEAKIPRKHHEAHVGDLLDSVLVSKRRGHPLTKLGASHAEEPLVIRANHNGKILKSGDQTGEYEVEVRVPPSINAYLREYQREGVRFLFRQYFKGTGGILADDMGLGKTVQCVAFATALIQSEGEGITGQKRVPILVVCPTSVIENWVREFSTWSSLKVGVYHGMGPIREATLIAAERGEVEVIITSYDLLRMHKDEFYGVPWHVAVFDEAHKLKNDRSQVYLACQHLPTKLRFGLTGTVMQNNFTELWCLMNWAVPGCLGEKAHFSSHYAKAIQMGQKIDSSKRVQQQGRERQAQLVKALSKVLLRRTKAVIQDQMPRKQDNVVFCELSPQQAKAYKRLLNSPDVQLLVNSDNPCPCGSSLTQAKCCKKHVSRAEGGVLWPQFHCCDCDNSYDPMRNPSGCKRHKPNGCKEALEAMGLNSRLDCPYCLVLPVLSLLRKISNHLELVKADRQRNPDQAQRDRAVVEMILGDDLVIHGGGDAQQNFLNVSDSAHCGKMAALEALMKLWHSQHDKVLIFSHSVKMLGIIQRVVLRNGYEYVTLDGSTAMKERQALVDEFNNRPSVFAFLISTTAGGLGLNLVSANRVVVFDPSWNPSHDLQAQDRAFRIGQKRDVAVYRLIAAGTLEEIVYTRQIYKEQQSNIAIIDASQPRYFEGVQDNKEFKGELWGISNLLKLTADSVFTRDLFDRNHSSHFRIQEIDTEKLGNGSTWGGASGIFRELDAEDEGLNQLAQRVVSDGSEQKARHDTELEQLREAGGAVYVHHHSAILNAKEKSEKKSDAMEDTDLCDQRPAHSRTTPARTIAQQSSSPKPPKQGASEASQAPRRSWGKGGGRKRSGIKIPKARPNCKRSTSNSDLKGFSTGKMSAIESLADWKGVGMKCLARQLFSMTKSERQHFLAQYCADESNPG